MKKRSIYFLFLFIGFFFSAQVSAVNQQVSLAVDQTVFSLAAFPGEEILLEINVSNLLDKEQLVSIVLGDLSIGENNQLELITEKNEVFGMREWLETSQEKQLLAPKENKKIDFKIKIPEEATVGSHYAGIFFRALPAVSGENFQEVLVGAQIGSLVLLNVKGEVFGGGRINAFQAPVVAKEKTALKVEFENTGNIHYIPHGEVAIKNLLTGRQEKIEIDKHFVFPNKKYFFENNWQGGSVWGIYLAKAAVVDGEQKFHFSSRLIFGRWSFLWLPTFLLFVWGARKIKLKYFSQKNEVGK